jgi:FKBP-type peptidyl-prolyl cis-trans isomerase
VQSLDDITSQSSDIPDLLTKQIIDLPPAVVQKRVVKKYAIKSVGVEPAHSSVNVNTTGAHDNVALQKQLTESQNSLSALQLQLQSTRQQLDEKSKQLTAINATRTEGKTSVADAKKQLSDNQSQITALKGQITTLTAAQVANSLELAAASQTVVNLKQTLSQSQADAQALKKSLSDTQNQAASLTQQVADLTATQTANAKALEKAKAGDSQTVANLKQTLSQSQADVQALKKSLSETQNQSAALTKQVADLTATQTANAKALETAKASDTKAVTDLKTALSESEKTQSETAKKWQDAVVKMDEQSKQITALQTAQKAIPVGTEAPKTKEDMRAYSLGTLWGQEIVAAISKVTSDGMQVDLEQVTSGVSDSINGHFKVTQDKIFAELDELNKKAQSKTLSAADKSQGSKYLDAFSKKAGAKHADMGYYYIITAKGQGKIKTSDIVAIQVKESLTNGKVIKDMITSDKVLVLPLKNFPPLFSSVIEKLGNKGKLTMVVPPELAYGDQGRPPQIPPNSTMVYEIRIVNVEAH